MKLNTYFPSQKSLATNHQIMCQRLEINSNGTTLLKKKIKQTKKNYSTIYTSTISAQTISESRLKLLSYPRQIIGTIKTKKSRHQQLISIHHPYLQYSIKKNSPSMLRKSGPPRKNQTNKKTIYRC